MSCTIMFAKPSCISAQYKILRIEIFFPIIGRPAAPVNLEVIDITEASVTISWLSPHSSGSSRIFRYVVEVCDVSSKTGWVKVKDVDSSARLVACVENLKEGKPYLFRVYAENQYGPGAATETMDAIVPRSQLGKFALIYIRQLKSS